MTFSPNSFTFYFRIYYFGEYFQIVIFIIKHLLLKPLVIFTNNYPIYLCLDSITQVSTLSLPTWVINEAAGWLRGVSLILLFLQHPTTLPSSNLLRQRFPENGRKYTLWKYLFLAKASVWVCAICCLMATFMAILLLGRILMTKTE